MHFFYYRIILLLSITILCLSFSGNAQSTLKSPSPIADIFVFDVSESERF